MTKYKVAELEGALLDAAVALAEAHPLTRGRWPYSTDWQFGGPIIEREQIAIVENGYKRTEWDAYVRGRYSQDDFLDGDGFASGPTPLIAAMRAYVASKFGDEVELP